MSQLNLRQPSGEQSSSIGPIRFAHLLREKKVHSRTFFSIPQPLPGDLLSPSLTTINRTNLPKMANINYLKLTFPSE